MDLSNYKIVITDLGLKKILGHETVQEPITIYLKSQEDLDRLLNFLVPMEEYVKKYFAIKDIINSPNPHHHDLTNDIVDGVNN